MGQGSFSGWTEAILFSVAFLTVLGIVVAGFNGMYGGSNVVPLTDPNVSSSFSNYIDTSTGQIEGGEADTQADAGITLSSSWGITKNVWKLVVTFLTGGWIEDTVGMLSLGASGSTLAFTLRLLYIMSMIFAVLYILFKVVA